MEVAEQEKCAFKAMFPAAIADFRPIRSSQVCQEPVVVLSVERYPRDPGSGGGLWEAPGGGDLYDLSLSEGHCRLRAVLQPSLNWMVRRNLLSSGCELSEVRLGLQYDESRLEVGVQVFVLLEAQVVSTGGCGATPAVRRLKPQNLPVFNEGFEFPFGPELPIKAKRRYYLPLWNNSDCYGEAWHRHPPRQPIQRFEGSCSIDVRLLEGYIQKKKKDLPPVIVRILRKFRLYHFGRPEKYSECPFQAKFLVADKSGSATLVLWNSLCMDWYRHLEPGMVVRLHNYVVKKSYTTRMGQHPEVSNEPDLELNLNPRNPAAEITVINAKNVREEWHLPELQYCFATRKEVSGLCSGDLCSIIGFVTFVGRQERIRNKVTLLVCTNVRLECKMIDPSGQTAFPYLQSTEYSQVYVNGHHHGKLYVKNPKVKEFINWIQSAKDQERDTLSHTQIGGCYTYPPLPPSERDYRREILGMSPLTTMSELKQYLNQLEYREYRQVTVQGRIKSVKYQLLGRMDEEFTEVYNAVGGAEECEELLDADQPFRGTRGNKSPVIPVMSGPPPKKQAGLSKKRKRKGTFCKRKCTPVRLGKDTESTGEEENPTHHLRKHEKDMNRDASPGKALNFIKACEEFCTDSDDMEETPSAMSLAHPIFSWTACPSQQEHIAHRGDISQMVARRFHFRDKSLLLKTFGLQPSNFSGIPAGQIEDLEHCEPACCCGYYTVTILGLNEELSLDAIFLPIISRLDHRVMYPAKHSNTLISILAHGGPASSQTCHIGADSAESCTPSPGDILRSAVGLEEMLFIFILDICNQGGTNVEVVLNRAYVQHRAL